jgi:tetratricopeptide (TPR) repeat protein
MTERQRFRDQIVASFSMDELETLCRDLGVDPDVIPDKDEGKAIWTDQIIAYFERRGKMPALLAALQHARSEQTWAYTPATMSLPDAPRKLPMGLIAGGAALAALVLIGTVVLSRPPAAQTPATNATPTVVSMPTVTPQRMPALKTNIYIADFGLIQDGKVVSIPESAPLSGYLIDGLNVELQDPNTLPAAVRSDFQPEIWGSDDAMANGWQIGPIGTLTDAQQVGEQLGAQVVIYGNVITESGASRLQLDFYVPQALKTADELAGGYAIGKPIPMQWPLTEEVPLGIRSNLNSRQRLMLRLTIGIAYDQAGQPEKALAIFNRALSDLNPPCGGGLEVLQFFIGREQLLLGNSEEAKQAHTEAVNCNPDFARALIGLGDANLQATRALSPEERLESESLQAAIDNYALAQQKALAEGHLQLATLAQLGTGLTQQLIGSTYYVLDENDKAQPYLADAIKLITPALEELSKRPDGQRRTLAIGYSLLGTAHWYSALITPEDEASTADKYLSQAKDNYEKCIALAPAGTETAEAKLAEIVTTCQNNLERIGQ